MSAIRAKRWRRGTLREVLRQGPRVVKRFTMPDGKPGDRPWIREHIALQRLAGEGFARTYGFTETRLPDGTLRVDYEREFVEGEPIGRVTEPMVRGLAEVLASIHRHGVITDDASRANFLCVGSDRYTFIDFGRARVGTPSGPWFRFWVGREHAKFFREVLNRDRALLCVFRDAYWSSFPAGFWVRLFVNAGADLADAVRRIRKRVQRSLCLALLPSLLSLLSGLTSGGATA
jgi:hypothetical protein